MAVTGFFTPFMAQVTADTTASGNDLYTLMSAVFTNINHKCCFLQIQLDTSAGGSTCYIGNSNVSTTMYGAQLSAGQIFQTLAFDSNLLVLDQIYIIASTSTVKLNVLVVTR